MSRMLQVGYYRVGAGGDKNHWIRMLWYCGSNAISRCRGEPQLGFAIHGI